MTAWAPERSTTGSSNGIAFIVAAGIVYEIIASCCSSPQTTEINAATRAPTLMKWVNIAMIQSAGFILVAAFLDRRHSWAVLTGGIMAGVIMYWQYLYARDSGLNSDEPETEIWGNGQ